MNNGLFCCCCCILGVLLSGKHRSHERTCCIVVLRSTYFRIIQVSLYFESMKYLVCYKLQVLRTAVPGTSYFILRSTSKQQAAHRNGGCAIFFWNLKFESLYKFERGGQICTSKYYRTIWRSISTSHHTTSKILTFNTSMISYLPLILVWYLYVWYLLSAVCFGNSFLPVKQFSVRTWYEVLRVCYEVEVVYGFVVWLLYTRWLQCFPAFICFSTTDCMHITVDGCAWCWRRNWVSKSQKK